MGSVNLCDLLISTLGLVKNSSLARYRNIEFVCPFRPGTGQNFQGAGHCTGCSQGDPRYDFSLRTSRQQLEQVFLNLILNAVQATEEGGQIKLSILHRDGGIEAAVSDDGEGIDPGDIERIFEPFFTTKPAGVGTGLGLSLSRRIIQSLGGRIGVESSPGKGTEFRVWLPKDRELLQEQLAN